MRTLLTSHFEQAVRIIHSLRLSYRRELQIFGWSRRSGEINIKLCYLQLSVRERIFIPSRNIDRKCVNLAEITGEQERCQITSRIFILESCSSHTCHTEFWNQFYTLTDRIGWCSRSLTLRTVLCVFIIRGETAVYIAGTNCRCVSLSACPNVTVTNCRCDKLSHDMRPRLTKPDFTLHRQRCASTKLIFPLCVWKASFFFFVRSVSQSGQNKPNSIWGEVFILRSIYLKYNFVFLIPKASRLAWRLTHFLPYIAEVKNMRRYGLPPLSHTPSFGRYNVACTSLLPAHFSSSYTFLPFSLSH